jgi:hypothetical protein
LLDFPLVQEKRLVSGQHALIRCTGSQCTLVDGAFPESRPERDLCQCPESSPHGVPLQDGDRIILAAKPQDPGSIHLVWLLSSSSIVVRRRRPIWIGI